MAILNNSSRSTDKERNSETEKHERLDEKVQTLRRTNDDYAQDLQLDHIVMPVPGAGGERTSASAGSG